jgi:hypothetical protein
LRQLLLGYNEFIGILAGSDRDILENPEKNEKSFKELEGKCKRIANEIQKSLEIIFWDDELFSGIFRKYAVF